MNLKHLLLVPTEQACAIVMQITRRGTQAELEAASLPAREAWLRTSEPGRIRFTPPPPHRLAGQYRRVLVVDYPQETPDA